jgi:hypothetical protein
MQLTRRLRSCPFQATTRSPPQGNTQVVPLILWVEHVSNHLPIHRMHKPPISSRCATATRQSSCTLVEDKVFQADGPSSTRFFVQVIPVIEISSRMQPSCPDVGHASLRFPSSRPGHCNQVVALVLVRHVMFQSDLLPTQIVARSLLPHNSVASNRRSLSGIGIVATKGTQATEEMLRRHARKSSSQFQASGKRRFPRRCPHDCQPFSSRLAPSWCRPRCHPACGLLRVISSQTHAGATSPSQRSPQTFLEVSRRSNLLWGSAGQRICGTYRSNSRFQANLPVTSRTTTVCSTWVPYTGSSHQTGRRTDGTAGAHH